MVPEDVALGDSVVPALVDLPYELLDAGAEALRSAAPTSSPCGRAPLRRRARRRRRRPDDATAAAVVTALVGETRGRLRALVADVEAGGSVVGVVSWMLLADGWRALRPHHEEDAPRWRSRRSNPRTSRPCSPRSSRR